MSCAHRFARVEAADLTTTEQLRHQYDITPNKQKDPIDLDCRLVIDPISLHKKHAKTKVFKTMRQMLLENSKSIAKNHDNFVHLYYEK